MNEPDAKRRIRKSLIEGVKMRCPRCERLIHIFHYVRLKTLPAYEDQTTPVYKCPRQPLPTEGGNMVKGCGFIFAPADEAVPTTSEAGLV